MNMQMKRDTTLSTAVAQSNKMMLKGNGPAIAANVEKAAPLRISTWKIDRGYTARELTGWFEIGSPSDIVGCSSPKRVKSEARNNMNEAERAAFAALLRYISDKTGSEADTKEALTGWRARVVRTSFMTPTRSAKYVYVSPWGKQHSTHQAVLRALHLDESVYGIVTPKAVRAAGKRKRNSSELESEPKSQRASPTSGLEMLCEVAPEVQTSKRQKVGSPEPHKSLARCPYTPQENAHAHAGRQNCITPSSRRVIGKHKKFTFNNIPVFTAPAVMPLINGMPNRWVVNRWGKEQVGWGGHAKPGATWNALLSVVDAVSIVDAQRRPKRL